jgi:hypothetical protein
MAYTRATEKAILLANAAQNQREVRSRFIMEAFCYFRKRTIIYCYDIIPLEPGPIPLDAKDGND